MNGDDQTIKVLEEIRDTSREHLAEYKRVTERSLDLQERAVARQFEIAALYRRMMALSGTLVLILIFLLAYLLVKWGPRLFR